jgi:hypothetical protein
MVAGQAAGTGSAERSEAMSYQLLSQAGVTEAVTRRRELIDTMAERRLARSFEDSGSDRRPSLLGRLRSWMSEGIPQRPARRPGAISPPSAADLG